jgi:hypothetical protein
MQCAYLTCQNRLAEAGILQVVPKKGVYLKDLAAKFPHIQFPQHHQQPFDYPRPSGMLLSKKALLGHGPFVPDSGGGWKVDDMKLLEKCIFFGQYRGKEAAGYSRYYLLDFKEPLSWQSPAEASFRKFYDALGKFDTTTPKQLAAFMLAGKWWATLQERRLGIARAVGDMTPDLFEEAFERNKAEVYSPERRDAWNTDPELTVAGVELVL